MLYRVVQTLVILSVPVQVMAAAVPGRWEKVETLVAQTPITVQLGSGEAIPGAFTELTGTAVVIENVDRGRVELPRKAVYRITSVKRISDSRVNGTLIGLAVGGGTGAILGAAGGGGGDFWVLSRGEMAAALGVFGAGVGAAIGFTADSLYREPEVFYVAR